MQQGALQAKLRIRKAQAWERLSSAMLSHCHSVQTNDVIKMSLALTVVL